MGDLSQLGTGRVDWKGRGTYGAGMSTKKDDKLPGWGAWLGLKEGLSPRRVAWLGPMASALLAVVGVVTVGTILIQLGKALLLGISVDVRNYGLLLSGVIGAGLVGWRNAVAARQAALQDESLFNDKINAAAADLATQRQVTTVLGEKDNRTVLTEWEDDVVTRCAAIDRLEGLAPVGRIQKVAADTSRSATDRLRHIIRDGVERRLSQGSRFVRLARLEAQIPPHLRQDYDQSRRAIYTVYLGLIKDGIETGEFRAVDPNVSAFAIIGMANWTSRWFRPDGRLSPEEVAEIITDLALTSLRGAETTDERMAALRARLGEVIGDLSDIANAAGPGDLF